MKQIHGAFWLVVLFAAGMVLGGIVMWGLFFREEPTSLSVRPSPAAPTHSRPWTAPPPAVEQEPEPDPVPAAPEPDEAEGDDNWTLAVDESLGDRLAPLKGISRKVPHLGNVRVACELRVKSEGEVGVMLGARNNRRRRRRRSSDYFFSFNSFSKHGTHIEYQGDVCASTVDHRLKKGACCFEVERVNGQLRMKINGATVLDAVDPEIEPLEQNRILLHIRALCFVDRFRVWIDKNASEDRPVEPAAVIMDPIVQRVSDPHAPGVEWLVYEAAFVARREGRGREHYMDDLKAWGVDRIKVNGLAFTPEAVWSATDRGAFQYGREEKRWVEIAVNKEHIGLPVTTVRTDDAGHVVFQIELEGKTVSFSLDPGTSEWNSIP